MHCSQKGFRANECELVGKKMFGQIILPKQSKVKIETHLKKLMSQCSWKKSKQGK